MKILLLFMFLNVFAFAQLRGDYLGQQTPTKEPQIFAPGVISTGLNEFNAVFSPDGNEFYFSVRSGWELFVVYVIKRHNGVWGDPEIAPFSGKYSDADPFITSDGSKLFFCSNRPAGINAKSADWNIWMCNRENNTWSEPIMLSFCNEKNEFYPTVSKNGNIYFHADYEGKSSFDLNRTDVYVSQFADGLYLSPEKLDSNVNSEGPEWDPFISPDEDYLIFTSPHPGGFGSGDMYISFRSKDGKWTKAVNMGEGINSPQQDYCPGLSPDGKYFFYSSYKLLMDPAGSKEYKDVYKDLLSYKNGSGNLYWVLSEVIEDLRPKDI